MKVVLRADVDNVGHKGDVVDVADGYARNFLLPRGWAMKASPGAEVQAERMRRSRSIRDAADRASATDIATRLVPMKITITARVGTDDRLFGSVGATDIIDAVAAQAKVELSRKQILLHEPIKTAGEHSVPVKLHSDVEFPVTIEIVGS